MGGEAESAQRAGRACTLASRGAPLGVDARRSENIDAIEAPAQRILCAILSPADGDDEDGEAPVTDGVLEALLRALAGAPPGGAAAQRCVEVTLQRSGRSAR